MTYCARAWKDCPLCLRRVPNRAKVCQHCHRDLPEEPEGVLRARELAARGKNLLGGSLLAAVVIAITNVSVPGGPVFGEQTWSVGSQESGY